MYLRTFVELVNCYTLTVNEIDKCFQDFFVTGSLMDYSESFYLSCHCQGLINCFSNVFYFFTRLSNTINWRQIATRPVNAMYLMPSVINQKNITKSEVKPHRNKYISSKQIHTNS